MIDYERMKRVGPKQKALLTRCKNIANPELRYSAVKNACTAAVKEWNEIGAWPDAWSLWQRALDDAAFAYQRVHHSAVYAPRLEEL